MDGFSGGVWGVENPSLLKCLYKNHFMDCPMPRVETQGITICDSLLRINSVKVRFNIKPDI